MRYVVSESGDLQSTASHEGSCDTESTKETVDLEATVAGVTGGKAIEEVACELVTMAIQNAVVELQHEVLKLFQDCMKLLECSFARLVMVRTWSQQFPQRPRRCQATCLWWAVPLQEYLDWVVSSFPMYYRRMHS